MTSEHAWRAASQGEISWEAAQRIWRINGVATWLWAHLKLVVIVSAYVATTYWANDGVWPWQ